MGGLLLAMAGIESAHADAKLPKAAVSYRDHPNGSKECANCSHYIRAIGAADPEAPGRCQIVAGPVGPQGYCIVYAERNPKNGC
ncbi:MAG: hypothetical protein KGL11_07660 [Alphaproteobacteria bacterium]|nr:hypothetical protein [Alphaproteobacteria bacterium]